MLNSSSNVHSPFSLAFMSDEARIKDSDLVAQALPQGAAFIFRDYQCQNREAKARALKEICTKRGVIFLIGADIELARRIEADGIHLPHWVRPSPEDLDGLIVSCACHNAAELKYAASINADIALLSPVFKTSTHPDAAGLGCDEFKRLASTASVPVLALGGVDETNAHALARQNVAGFAAIGAFLPR